MPNRDPFASLPVLVAVVESGSFSAAATRLGLTPSAVSKRINALEQQLGVQLLQRTTRSFSLTEAGDEYYRDAHRAWQLMQHSQARLQQRLSHPQGTLSLSLPMVFGRRYISPLLPQFLQRYPDVGIDLMLDDRMIDLVQEGIDVAIRIGHLPDSPQVATRLAPCQSVLCASPAYLDLAGIPTHPAQLQHHNCLHYSYFLGGSHWQLGSHRVQPSGNFRANSSDVLLDALLAGVGIAQMPTFIVADSLKAGRLVALMPDHPLPRHNVYALSPGRHGQPAKTRVFIEFLQQTIGHNPPPWER
ncbi:LysR family transcriptional regulator [Ferrimonas kyonanensis]|uniref:LysR family transcriptional regulator n=1 Tax=Ferrimonas kyonanensis TaxID=364763 RepID=UPI000423FC09|nr:LysR family transcriptional regulator [Ferrimonas kyonanensis]